MNFSGFGYMWGGCFADHGVLSGNGGFEVKFVEALEFTDDDPALLNSDPKPVSDKTSSEPNKTGEDNTENPAKESDAASDEVEEISSVSKTESSICRFGWTVQETVKKTKIKTSSQSNLDVSEVLVLIKKTCAFTPSRSFITHTLLGRRCPLETEVWTVSKILNFRFIKTFSEFDQSQNLLSSQNAGK